METARWLADPAHWSGPGGIPTRLGEHVRLSAVPLVVAALVALPAGILSGHHRRWQAAGAAVANAGRAMPTLALLVLGIVVSTRVLDLGFRYWPAVLALFFLALHPLFTNAYTAVRQVDRATIEAARGMGMAERQVITAVELPIAAPVIVAAVRITTVQVIATVPIAALAAGGGFGRYIIDGFQQRDHPEMLAGTALVAALALAAEWLLTRLERAVVPPTLGRAELGEVAATGRAV